LKKNHDEEEWNEKGPAVPWRSHSKSNHLMRKKKKKKKKKRKKYGGNWLEPYRNTEVFPCTKVGRLMGGGWEYGDRLTNSLYSRESALDQKKKSVL